MLAKADRRPGFWCTFWNLRVSSFARDDELCVHAPVCLLAYALTCLQPTLCPPVGLVDEATDTLARLRPIQTCGLCPSRSCTRKETRASSLPMVGGRRLHTRDELFSAPRPRHPNPPRTPCACACCVCARSLSLYIYISPPFRVCCCCSCRQNGQGRGAPGHRLHAGDSQAGLLCRGARAPPRGEICDDPRSVSVVAACQRCGEYRSLFCCLVKRAVPP